MEHVAAHQSKPKNMGQLSKLLTSLQPEFEKERYGSRENKTMYSLTDFFKVLEGYYALTHSSRGKKTAASFFRSTAAQEKFHEKLEEVGQSAEAADHVISTSVFKHILLNCAPKFFALTYDYFGSCKTTLNECWNFQPLTEKENSTKGGYESRLGQLLDSKDFAKILNDENLLNYVTSMHTLLTQVSAVKPLWPQSLGTRSAIDKFFSQLNFQPIPWIDAYPKAFPKCPCIVCAHCRDHSANWRAKYAIMLEKPMTGQEIQKAIATELLQSFLKKIAKESAPTGVNQQNILLAEFTNSCQENGIEELWVLWDNLDEVFKTPLLLKKAKREKEKALCNYVSGKVCYMRKCETTIAKIEEFRDILPLKLLAKFDEMQAVVNDMKRYKSLIKDWRPE